MRPLVPVDAPQNTYGFTNFWKTTTFKIAIYITNIAIWVVICIIFRTLASPLPTFCVPLGGRVPQVGNPCSRWIVPLKDSTYYDFHSNDYCARLQKAFQARGFFFKSKIESLSNFKIKQTQDTYSIWSESIHF
jgi:hypothetical protein